MHPENLSVAFRAKTDQKSAKNRFVSQISENYRPWKEAKPIYRRLAKEYGLKNREDWRKFVKSHKKLLEKLRIPANPQNVYTKERELKRMMKDG